MRKLRYLMLLPAAMLFTSCLDNEFLDKKPQDKLTEEVVFTEDKNFQVYANSLYDVFPAYSSSSKLHTQGAEADDFFIGAKGSQNKWSWHLVKVPTTGGGWDYSFIRKVNIMLDNVENKDNKLTDAERTYWRSFGYFFRSYEYFELVKKFGDVVWIDHVLSTDSEELYKPRDSRDFVIGKILGELKYAEDNIVKRGANTIDKNVVRALISRICLFEGTWKKYHGTTAEDQTLSEKYLKECVRVSKELIKTFPDIHDNYDEVFNSMDLSGMPGIILFKQYIYSLSTHNITRINQGADFEYEMCKDAVDSYLCKDGKPIYMQPGYPAIEQDPYTEFADRDKRLYYTVIPPYRVDGPKEAFTVEWHWTDNPKDATFAPLMNEISDERHKPLPIRQNFHGSVAKISPHFTLHNYGYAFMGTQGGYFIYKYQNNLYPSPGTPGQGEADAPIFRIEEVMLNLAEASVELDEYDQELMDLTINKLRKRAGVAPLDVSNVLDDERRDPSVSPILWEVRRERRLELMAEPFRFDDLRRWKKCDYLNKEQFGRWYSVDQLLADKVIKKASECKIKFTEGTKGYITYHGKPLGWLDHYYLYPLPLDDLELNPNLTQNPGWEN